MKICALVVWYNPEKMDAMVNPIQNIKTYSALLEKVYIIDNSDTSHRELASNIPNASYLANYKNLGIAKALNLGCSMAIKDGYDWVLTMDQDSSWRGQELKLFIDKCIQKNQTDSTIVSFSPDSSQPVVLSYAALLKRRILGKKYKQTQERQKPSEEYPNAVITSGNLISLDAFQKVQGFTEALFIDEVDFDFCFRLKENKYNIIKFNDVKMRHSLGNWDKRTIFSKHMKHKGKRIYYIIRNKLVMQKLHPLFTERYDKDLRNYFFDCCVFNLDFLKNWIYFIRAYKDAKSVLNEILLNSSYYSR